MINKLKSEQLRHALRLSKVLSKQPNIGCSYVLDGQKFTLSLGKKDYTFEDVIVSDMKQKKLITVSSGRIKLTEAGLLYLKKTLNPYELLACSKNVTQSASVLVNNEHQQVQMNTCESPLMRLFTRKSKTGDTYISMEEFQAGERLRKDFERGQLQPKISANLQGAVGSSRQTGFNDAGDITDFAIDARNRVGKAIEKLGPELSGVTLDICCFLKGLESVERERRWPPRSAKLMLKTALSQLARHYGISGYQNNRSNKRYFWGSDDFRPMIDT